ncbi:ATP-grasp fold amidoligase family protein [Geothrix sp. 21YS21S-4]|uniref:ATP-grasp fold amidoligase family protein n=1 Tax=Geothrix sp. 21YS21S-4 TaxID=3068889 RepID=UPI0027B9585C|nr:ATP-grasp fold amidoligase family protein [Geothrix sp. 21YS21S-4]
MASRSIYRDRMGKDLDLGAPRNFNEKLQWLKLYWRHPLVPVCADKARMKGYAADRGFPHLVPQTLGVYGDVRDIPWAELPDRFVLKCTHGCGFNILCPDKSRLDVAEAARKLRRWLKTDYSLVAAELHYAEIPPRILCEEYLTDGSGPRPIDYKVYCFGGKPHCILACADRGEAGEARFDFYDAGWTARLPYCDPSISLGRDLPAPASLPEMLAACEALAQPFPFVRMDFYDIGGRARLGEMTFTPMGCAETGYTEQALDALGRLLELPAKRP